LRTSAQRHVSLTHPRAAVNLLHSAFPLLKPVLDMFPGHLVVAGGALCYALLRPVGQGDIFYGVDGFGFLLCR
jgi:hypothetical protein